MRLFYFGFAVLLSVALGLLSVFNALYLDWSLLEIGVICIMPALVIMDLFCMAAQVWAVRRGGMKKENTGSEIASLSSLAALHLLTAALAVVLLACPTAGVWTAGPGMLRVHVPSLCPWPVWAFCFPCVSPCVSPAWPERPLQKTGTAAGLRNSRQGHREERPGISPAFPCNICRDSGICP